MEVNCPELWFVQQYYTRANVPPYANYTRTIRGDPKNSISASFVLYLKAFCMILAMWACCLCKNLKLSGTFSSVIPQYSPPESPPALQPSANDRHPKWPSGQIWPNPSE